MAARSKLRRDRRSGFALLFVLAMGAAMMILLYMEMPRIVFEGQRRKEALLVERGEQYRRGIQVFARKNKRLPQTLEELEKFQDRRFLRHKYKDPMTGKDEWRLVHVNAAGAYVDSLVHKPPDPMGKDKDKDKNAQNGQTPGTPQSNAAFPNAPGMMYTGAVPGQPGAQPGQVYPGQPGYQPGQMMPGQPGYVPGQTGQIPAAQLLRGASDRPPALATMQPGANPYDPNRPYDSNNPNPTQYPNQPTDPNQPVDPNQQTNGAQPSYPGAPGTIPSNAPPGMYPGQTPYPGQPQYPGQTGTPQGFVPQFPGQQYPGQTSPFPNGAPPYPGAPGYNPVGGVSNSQTGGVPRAGSIGAGGFTAPGAPSDAARQLLDNILRTPRQGGVGGMAGGAQGLGAGIVGVATKFEGEGIRVYNEKTNYKEWEFLYDQKQEKPPGSSNMAGFGNQNQQGSGLNPSQMGSGMNPTPNPSGMNPSFPQRSQ